MTKRDELLALADTMLAVADQILKVKPTMRGHSMEQILDAAATSHLQARALRALAQETPE